MRHRVRRTEHLLQLHQVALHHAVGDSEGIKSGQHLEEGLKVSGARIPQAPTRENLLITRPA